VSAAVWSVAVTVPIERAAAFEAALAPLADTLSAFDRGDGAWELEALSQLPPDRRAIDVAFAVAAAVMAVPPPEPTIERVTERDWLAENRERFASFRIGRFQIQEPKDETPVPPGVFALRIEAGTAFGSGRHGSTEGCLRALQMLRGRPVRRPLDLGCGSGILAIAAAKLWRVPVLASDVDSRAIEVARANARLNGVGRLVRALVADGYRSPAIAAGRPFDLVLCNILARPLKCLAKDLARHLAPGGIAVLAGLLAQDGNDVLAAHRAVGLRLVRQINVDGWRTLVGRAPSGFFRYFRCSLRRGINSTKLQGRYRESSWWTRMSSQASLQAPGEPGSANR
jgi:ribosomal protein L11 methyltransferase